MDHRKRLVEDQCRVAGLVRGNRDRNVKSFLQDQLYNDYRQSGITHALNLMPKTAKKATLKWLKPRL
jgi:hypothetical protein